MPEAETPPNPLVVTFDHPGVGQIELHGEFESEYVFNLIRVENRFYESDLLWILERIGLSNGLVVDAGSHIGNHTVFFAKVMGLQTLAVEPRPESVVVLRQNIAANHLEEFVTVVQAVLGAEPGRARLEWLDEKNTGTVVARQDAQGTVDVLRLDDLVDAPVVLMKVDVEGSELAVLGGAMDLIGRHRPLISVEAHSGRALHAVDDLLRPFDYQPIAIAGRSDNYVFASSSPLAPIPYARAEARAALLVGRWRDQMLHRSVHLVADRVRSVGVQLGRFDVLEERLDQIEDIARGQKASASGSDGVHIDVEPPRSGES